MDYVCFSLRLPHPDVDLHPRQPESKENQNKCQTTGKRKGGGRRHKWKTSRFNHDSGWTGAHDNIKYANLGSAAVYLLCSLETDQIPSVVAVVMAAFFSEYQCS